MQENIAGIPSYQLSSAYPSRVSDSEEAGTTKLLYPSTELTTSSPSSDMTPRRHLAAGYVPIHYVRTPLSTHL